MSNGTTIILEKGASTEDEYLKTIQEYFKDNKYMRNLTTSRNVRSCFKNI